MKNDATVTILNVVLATTVIAGVICGYLAITRVHQQRAIAVEYAQDGSKLMMAQSLFTDVNNYNQQARSAEISQMLQPFMPKNAPASK